MRFLLCPHCVELRRARKRCEVCSGPLVPVDEASLERLLEIKTTRRMRAQLARWMEEGKLPDEVAVQLMGQLEEPALFPPPPRAPPPPEATAPGEATHLRRSEPPAPVRLEEPAPVVVAPIVAEPIVVAPVVRRGRDEEREDHAPVLADAELSGAPEALGALAALDEPESEQAGVGSWLYENAGWFVGATLVLAGSLYGVREAWQSLGDVPRHLVVAAALLGYHGGFVGVGAVLARSSAGAARVMASIGWLLLPVVFVALSSLVATSLPVGLGAAALASGLVFLSQRSVAARLPDTSATSLSLATLPALVAMLPIDSQPMGAWPRHLAPLLGLLGVVAATRARDAWALVAAVVASGAVWFFSISGLLATTSGPGSAALPATTLWVVLLAWLVREGVTEPAIASRRPTLARGVGTVALAVTACAALSAWLGRPGSTATNLAYLLASLAAVGVFARALTTSPRALHLLVPAAAIASSKLLVAVVPALPSLRSLGPSLVASLVLFWGARQRRPDAAAWGLGLGMLAALSALGAPPWQQLLVGVPLALATYVAASTWPALHYASGVVVAMVALNMARQTQPDGPYAATGALVFGVGYGALAFWRRRAPGTLRPLEDLSLLGLLAAAGLSLVLPPLGGWPVAAYVDRWPTPATLARELGALGPVGPLAAIGLLLRARLDRAHLVATAAVLAATLSVLATSGVGSLFTPSHLVAALALACALLAALLRAAGGAPAVPSGSSIEAPGPRKLLGVLPLGHSVTPVAEGFGQASVALFVAAQAGLVDWMTALTEPRRPFLVQAAALATATAATWFFTPALRWARGASPVLAVTAVSGVLIALANRLGRPLPPEQVALRLTVVVVVVWVLAELLARQGQALADRLGRPAHGPHYGVLATVGLGLVGLVLLVDGALVATTAPPALAHVPPLFALGAALGAVLLGRLRRSLVPLHVASALGLLGAALVGAQHGALGIPFARQPDGAWQPALQFGIAPTALAVTAADALRGATGGAALLALLAVVLRRTPAGRLAAWWTPPESGAEPLVAVLRLWAALGVVGCAAAAGWQSSRESSAAMMLTGALLALAGRASLGALLAGTGAALWLHAFGFAQAALPLWTGPVLAALGVGAVVAIGARPSRTASVGEMVTAHLFAAGCGVLGLLHALAVGSRTTADASLGALLAAVSDPSAAGWVGTFAPTWVLALSALGVAAGAWQASGHASLRGHGQRLAAWAPILGGATAALAWLTHTFALSSSAAASPFRSLVTTLRFVGPETTRLASALALLALGVHLAVRMLARRARPGHERAEALGHGLRTGRDALLTGLFVLVTWHVVRAGSLVAAPPRAATMAGALALGVMWLVAVHAAWREVSPRQVFFAQLATMGAYAMVRSTTASVWPPEVDAVCALLLGFVLVGVTVLARRAGLAPVARTTRLLAALLPLLVALLLGDEEGLDRMAGALGSAMLYGALAWVERSRWLGALGAIAVNLALLAGALSAGLDGVEIYLAPLGLFLLALGHLFAGTLDATLRQWLRVMGTLLLYLPAGWSIVFQLGRAPDARYALAFGAISLGGVAAGMALRIRAYLLLGSAFLLLDLVANLIHAGLRDHRIGFLILSAAGLMVLGGMVLSTLRRNAFQRLVRRFRGEIAGWD